MYSINRMEDLSSISRARDIACSSLEETPYPRRLSTYRFRKSTSQKNSDATRLASIALRHLSIPILYRVNSLARASCRFIQITLEVGANHQFLIDVWTRFPPPPPPSPLPSPPWRQFREFVPVSDIAKDRH